MNPPAKILTPIPDTCPSLLVSMNKEYGLTVPRALPRPWSIMDTTEKGTSMWYVHNVLSYFDKNQIARHIIGCEILENQSRGITPLITEARANRIWEWVFNRNVWTVIPDYADLEIESK